MSKVRVLTVIEADYQWDDKELVVLASDYDQLKADNEAYKKLHDWLKAENERLAAMLNQAVSEGILLSDQRDTLRADLETANSMLVATSKAGIQLRERVAELEVQRDMLEGWRLNFLQAWRK